MKDVTQTHLINFASIGLRTLMIAKRSINAQEYEEWVNEYKKACSSIQDREMNVWLTKFHK